MASIILNDSITDVKFNNTSIDKVIFNGVTVWEKNTPIYPSPGESDILVIYGPAYENSTYPYYTQLKTYIENMLTNVPKTGPSGGYMTVNYINRDYQSDSNPLAWFNSDVKLSTASYVFVIDSKFGDFNWLIPQLNNCASATEQVPTFIFNNPMLSNDIDYIQNSIFISVICQECLQGSALSDYILYSKITDTTITTAINPAEISSDSTYEYNKAALKILYDNGLQAYKDAGTMFAPTSQYEYDAISADVSSDSDFSTNSSAIQDALNTYFNQYIVGTEYDPNSSQLEIPLFSIAFSIDQILGFIDFAGSNGFPLDKALIFPVFELEEEYSENSGYLTDLASRCGGEIFVHDSGIFTYMRNALISLNNGEEWNADIDPQYVYGGGSSSQRIILWKLSMQSMS